MSKDFRYDAFVSYCRADYDWVRDTLLPRLVSAGLRIAVLGQIHVIGIAQVTDSEQSMAQSTWIVAVLSPAYLADTTSQQELLFAVSLSMNASTMHLLPVYITPQSELQLPKHVAMLRGCDLSHPETATHEFELLVQALRTLPASFGRVAPQIPQRSISEDAATSTWKYDVFVVFSYADMAWVERELLPHLESQGLRLAVAFRDFAPGGAANEPERLIRSSRKTLLVLTSEFLRSGWDAWKYALSRVLSNGGDIVAFLEAGWDVPQELLLFPVVHFETQSGRERTRQRLLHALSDEGLPGVLPEYNYDVFVACGQADLEWARAELLPRLMQSGLRCTIAYRDFTVEQPVVAEYERALRTSRRTLLVLTREYLAQGWSDFDAALQAVPIQREARLIPLVEAGCALPVRISHLGNAAFVKQMSVVWEQLLRALA